jgi:hypothetical protein
MWHPSLVCGTEFDGVGSGSSLKESDDEVSARLLVRRSVIGETGGLVRDEYALTLLACFAIFRFIFAIALSLTRSSSHWNVSCCNLPGLTLAQRARVGLA